MKEKKSLSRKAKHGIISLAVTCLVVVAVIIINIIAVTLTDKYSALTADITGMQSFNITEQSLKIAQEIKKDTKITFLNSKSSYESLDPYCKQTSALANQLAQNSDGKISVEYVDLVKNPSFQNKYPDDTLSTTDVIVSCGDKYKILTKDDLFTFENYSETYQYIKSSQAEQEIDSAILTVTSDVSTKVALVTDNCTDDYSYLKSVLNTNNYEITEVSLLTQDIPDDTDTVIVYAPTKDYTYDAVEKLEKFLVNNNRYGKNMLYVSYCKKADTPNIDALIKNFGIKIDDGLAFDMDTSRIFGNNYYDGLACNFASDKYTSSISSDAYPVIVSLSRTIQLTNEDVAENLLVLSSQSGYCPFDAKDGEWSMPDAVTGNVSVMAQGTLGNDTGKSTLVVAGSSSMFEKAMLGSSFSNQKYLMNMLADLNGRDTDTLTLEDKVITDYDLKISTQTANIVGIILYAVIPLMILGAGFVVFLMRRNR
ncbi:MAG: GldG family protein [Clostridia bacterium]|nr:GldG family protein [Clostridia bacterium]